MSHHTYYFAYGSNMNRRQMQRRCPHAKPVAKAELPGWGFYINERGVASIYKDRSERVFGVVYKLTSKCEEALDVCEGVDCGLYGKFKLGVYTIKTDKYRQCLVYIDPSEHTSGRPRTGYLEKILVGASSAKLPKPYILELLDWR